MRRLSHTNTHTVAVAKEGVLTLTYLTPGSSRTLAVMSTASGRSFSTSCSRSHSSFLGPKIPFLDLSPCFIMCSKTMKKCCKGMWSESNWWPNRRLESRTSLITNFSMFTRLLFSIWMGSRSVKTKRCEVEWVKIKESCADTINQLT